MKAEESKYLLWRSLPACQAAWSEYLASIPEDQLEFLPWMPKPNFTAPLVHVRPLILSIYRACFANSTLGDAYENLRFVMAGEAVLPVYDQVACFELIEKAINLWAPPEQLAKRVVRHDPAPEPDPRAEVPEERASMVPITVLDEFYEQLVAALLYDEEPRPLLPLENVLLLQNMTLRKVEIKFEQFVQLDVYRDYPLIYDTLWCELFHTTVAPTPECPMPREKFDEFFNLVYCSIFKNGTRNRARDSGGPIYCQFLNREGIMTPLQFRRAAKYVAELLAKRTDPEAFYLELDALVREVMASMQKSHEEDPEVFPPSCGYYETAGVAVQPKQLVLDDPLALHLLDELQETPYEKQFLTQDTDNRLLVVGSKAVGKSTLAKALAERLNAVHVDTYALALEAMHDLKDTALGKGLRESVASGTPIALELQAELITRCLRNPATRHRGYVLGDIPVPMAADDAQSYSAARIDAFVRATGLLEFVPTGIVQVSCNADMYPEWLYLEESRRRGKRDMELQTREREQATIDAPEARRHRAAEIARLTALRSDLASGHLSLDETSVEDQAMLEALAAEEAEKARRSEEQGEEEAADAEAEEAVDEEVDEDGNALSEEDAREVRAARAAARAIRIQEEDLFQLLLDGRGTPAGMPEETVPVESLPALADIRKVCETRRRIVEVGNVAAAKETAEFVVEYFALSASVVPEEPPLSADDLQGIDAGDVERLGELKRQLLEEDPSPLLPSHWKQFCPVTYAEHRVLIPGLWAFACSYRGKLYHCASHTAMQQFIASPHSYLAQSSPPQEPVLLLQRRVDTFGQEQGRLQAHVGETMAGVSELVAELAKELRLTPMPFQQYTAKWSAFRRETEERELLQQQRETRDALEMAQRKVRLDARLKLEKKLGLTKKKRAPPKKKSALNGVNGTKRGRTVQIADEPAVEFVEPVEELPMAPRLPAAVEAALEKKATLCPLLLPLLGSDLLQEPEQLREVLQLLDEQRLPERTIVFDCFKPRYGDEEEEEAEVAEDAEAEAAAIPADFDQLNLALPSHYTHCIDLLTEKLQAKNETQPSEVDSDQMSQVTVINIYGKTLREVLLDVLEVVHPLTDVARDLEGGEEVEEDPDDEEADELLMDEENGPVDEELLNIPRELRPEKRAIHQFGDLLKYCPVTMRDLGYLLEGDAELCLMYKGRKYLFADEDKKEIFRANPKRYASPNLNVPPRLWLMGVGKAGRKTLAKSLSETYGIPIFFHQKDFFDQLLEAGKSEEGMTLGPEYHNLFVPKQDDPVTGNPFFLRALQLIREREEFDADQARQTALKAKMEAELEKREQQEEEENEEVEELPEADEAAMQEAIEWDAEEAAEREERHLLSHRRVAAALMRMEPFASQGYLWIGSLNEEELNVTLQEGSYPEAVVHLTITDDEFSIRSMGGEFERRFDAWKSSQKDLDTARSDAAWQRRLQQLNRWRRRNIGAGDDEADTDIEDPKDEEEMVDLDALKGELKGGYGPQLLAVTDILELLPERRIPVISVNGNAGVFTVLGEALNKLSHLLEHRRSLLRAVQVLPYDDAIHMLGKGSKVLSCFRFRDPVRVQKVRLRVYEPLKSRPPGKLPGEEAASTARLPGTLGTGHVRFALDEEDHSLSDTGGRAPTHAGEAPDAETMEGRAGPVVPGEGSSGTRGTIGRPLGVYNPQEEEQLLASLMPLPGGPMEDLESDGDLDEDELEEMQAEHEARKGIIHDRQKPKAAILGHRIYFFEGLDHLSKFLKNPLAYWDQAPPLPRMPTGPIIAVYEKTEEPATFPTTKLRCMADHIALNLGTIMLNIPRLLKWAFFNTALLSFSTRARETLLGGTPIDPELLSVLLAARLRCPDILQKGVVLHNLPRVEANYQAMTRANLHLHKVFNCRAAFGEPMADIIRQEAAIVHDVSAEIFSLSSLIETVTDAKDNLYRHRDLLLRLHLGFPAPTWNTNTPEAIMEANLSSFIWYCPYKWIYHQELVDMRHSRLFTALYQGKFYHFSEKAYLEEFLKFPERTSGEVPIAEAVLELPDKLPQRAIVSQEALDAGEVILELTGCCPVTLYQTRFDIGVKGIANPVAVQGDRDLIAEYKGRYYTMANAKQMDQFLRQPWVYAVNAVLPVAEKLPMEEAVLMNETSDDVYIRRTLYDYMARSLVAVAVARPKYPGLSVEQSALKYLALHLKSRNEKNTQVRQEQYQRNFDEYAQAATLYQSITTTEPTDPPQREMFAERCRIWDEIQDLPDKYKKYIHLEEMQ